MAVKPKHPVTVKKQTAASARAHVRADRWVNERNQFGGTRDPISRTTFFRDFSITREFIEALYRYDWMTRRAVEIPANDATREWLTIKHDDPKRVQDAEREIRRLNIRGKIEELILLSRLYGGATLIVGAWDGREPTEELGTVREVRFMSNIDRYLAYPLTFYKDQNAANYGDVETYQVTRPQVTGTAMAIVHETRVIRMDGNYLPPLERIRNFTYGASVIENILEATRNFGVCTQGLAGVIQDFVVKKLKVDNLQELLQTSEGQDALMSRLGEMAAGMSMYGIATFGADEEFEKMGTPITGLPDMADRFVEYASAATGIPRARLFNNLSGRLGGDAGENDLRVHYDTIRAFQNNRLTDPVARLLNIVLQPLGFEPDEIQFEWKPLWQLTDKEQADLRYVVAQTDQIYITTGVVEAEEVAMTRFSGDGVNVHDMHIETAPREKFLEAFAKGELPQQQQPQDDLNADPNADPNAPPEGDEPADDDGDQNDDDDDNQPKKESKTDGRRRRRGNGIATH